MTYEQAVLNQWNVAYHRIVSSKENQKPCKCDDCREHFAAIKDREEGKES